jgi:hypothetical protein
MLILKQNAANTVPTPPSGKGTIFLDDSDTLSVKTSDGNVENFPTVAAANSQVLFMNGTSLSGENAFTYDFNNNVLNVLGNVAANNIKTDNLLYANGSPWDLQEAAGSNNQIQFNLSNNFAASANFTYNDTTQVFTVIGNAQFNNANAGNLLTANFVSGTLTTASQPNITTIGSLTNLNVSGNAVIGGNLTVDGNLVYVNVETLAIEDPIINLQSGPNGASPTSNSGKDVGTALNYYDTQAQTAFMGWDVSNAEFGLASQSTIAGEVVTFTTYGNLRANVYFGNAAGLTNIPGGNITGNISGNISNATHAVTANTVVDNAQPNITSVGTLSSLAVTGNTSAGNLSTGGVLSVTGNANVGNLGTAGAITATGNVTANFFIGNGSQLTGIDATAIQNGSANVRTFLNANVAVSAAGNANVAIVTGTGVNVAGTVNATGNVSAAFFIGNGSQLTGIDATTIQNGTANVRTFLNGNVAVSASGNANIVLVTGTGANINGTLNVTGNANVGNLGTAGLITATGNVTGGNLTTAGALSVTGNANVGNIGATAGVFNGNISSLNANLGNLVTANYVNVAFDLNVAGNANIGSGSGGTITGANLLSANFITGTLTTASQPNITSVGTLTSLAVTGNVTAGNFVGSFANGNSSITIPAANGNIVLNAANGTSELTITSTGVNVAGTLNATGNANVGNLGTAGLITATGNVTGGNLTTGGVLSVTGNANVGNLGTARVIATGNISGTQLISNIATGTAPLVVTSTTKVANLNAELLDGYDTSLTATANTVVVRDTNANIVGNNITGTLVTASQTNITSVGTLTGLGVNGNITAANITANTGVFTGNGSGLTNLAGANITGTVANATHASTANTVVDAAQPNITSVGTLTSLAVTGNASAGNLSTGGTLSVTGNANVGNIGATGVVATTLGGTLTTAAQPNITSVGTLTSLAVTGNVTAGNVYANSGTIGASLLAGTLTTAAQPNITSIGTLSSLSVTGNVTAGNFVGSFANGNSSISIPAANGNINITAAGGTTELVVTSTGVNVAGTLNATGNANVGNLGTAGLITATGNVSGGNLTTAGALSVTGNANVGNIGATVGVFTGNISAGNLTTTGVLSVTGTGVSSIAGNLDMTSNNITNLAEPVNSTDAATKNYVDSVAEGLHTHDSCNAATTGTLATISGGTVTYNNGTNGVGATLTTTGSYTTIDGVTLSDGMRILVKDESTAAHNGIYVRTSSTVLTRATDFDTPAEMAGGDFTFVTGGTLYDNTGWVMTDAVTTVGTSPVNWTQFSGAGTYTAGTGLTLTGSQFSVNASQSQITSVGTLTGLNVNGNITAANITANTGVFTGNGSGLSAIAGGNVTGQVANALVAGTVYTAAQPNITSVGTLTSLAVTGNASAGNISTGGVLSVTGNANVGNLGTAGLITATGNITGGNLTTGGVLSVTGNANVGNLGTATAIITTGNITTINSGLIQNGNSNIAITNNGNISMTAAGGTVELVITSTGVNVAGTLNATGNANVGNLGTAGLITATGNVSGGNLTTGGVLSVTGNANVGNLGTARVIATGNISGTQLISNIATGTAPLVVTSTTQVANLNAATAGSATSATTAGTVTTAAQPNITSVGTLTSLTLAANGNITMSGTLSQLSGANLVSATNLAGTLTTAAQTNITSVGTLTGLGVNGNITAANITANTGVFTGNANGLSSLQAGNLVGTVAQARLANSTLTLGSTTLTLGGTTTTVAGLTSVTSTTFVGALTGAATTAGTVTTAAQPNITSVGTLTGLTLANAAVLSWGSNTNVGTITGNISLSAGSRLQATYADLAEKYAGDASYEVGTVLVFGGDQEVTIANEHDSHRVAGVVSESAAYIMNSGIVADHPITLALTGRVPVKVHGPVAKGDLMVSGPNGHAVANNMARAGTILGKALQNFKGSSGIIEVVVGRV